MSYRLNLLSGIALAAVIAVAAPDDPLPVEAHAVAPPPVERARISGPAVTPAALSSPVPTIWMGLATEGEARARLEVQGYSAIAALVKGDDGVWRGTAMRLGRRVDIGVDARGNVGVTGARD